MSRRFHPLLGVACIAALVAIPSASHAFGVSGAGGKLGYASPENLDGTAMVGGHVELEESGNRLHLVPNLMYWKVDRVSDVNPNLDVYYHFRPEGEPSPYLGGGVGLNRNHSELTDRSETNVGANVIGGMRFPSRSSSNSYFVEGRFTASEVSQVALMGGITFRTP
jgi:hypothetical protein